MLIPFRRFFRAQEGAAALEFAILGPIHLGLLLSFMEAGLVLTKKTLLDHAASEAAKAVYIGAVSDGTVSKDDLEATACRLLSIMQPDCDENVTIELTPVSSFDSDPGGDLTCRDNADDDKLNPTVRFIPGAPNEIMFMRLCLTTNVYVPGLAYGLNLDRTASGRFELISLSAYLREPA